MLEAQGRYNQLSDKLRASLEKKLEEAGRIVTYKFAIAKLNPDGEQRVHGKYLYPLHWALTPITFQIHDSGDKKMKTIALVVELKENGAISDKLRRIVLQEAWQGTLRLDMSLAEDRDAFAYLELHPKNENGLFRDTNQVPIFKRIDQAAEARKGIQNRKLRLDALYVASNMQLNEVRDFACAIGWDEYEDESILRERIETLAERDAQFFVDFIDTKHIEFRAALQRAMNNNVIAYLPVESKVVWVTNGASIAVLERAESDTVLERLTDWVMTSKNGMEVFGKIKGMLSEKAKVATK